MRRERILIAGIGNIFLGDDAFGCEVTKLLFVHKLPEEVKVVDFGIRSFDLAYALMDGYETTIFVDATPRGGTPGDVYVIEPELDAIDGGQQTFEAHDMDPVKVLKMVRSMGGEFGKIFVVGCEPQFTGEDGEGHMGLSEVVETALPKAVEVIRSLVDRLLNEKPAQMRAFENDVAGLGFFKEIST